jgi:L-ascorbate metabolism protein UlaG (beta-lactamase superfamily)
MKHYLSRAVFVVTLALTLPTWAATELTWYGHSSYKIVTPNGKTVLIDPWLDNPVNPNGKKDIEALDSVDLILVTHGHFDHLADATKIADNNPTAMLVATLELGKAMVKHLKFPEGQFNMGTAGFPGGEISLLDGEVKIGFVPAVHGGSVEADGGDLKEAGIAVGFVVSVKNGPRFYHTGDTDLFSDMKLVNEFGKIDAMMVCIGDRFTMGPERAAEAVKLVNAKLAIPMHYGTFNILSGTPEAFDKALKKRGVKTKMKEMKVGQTIKFD